MAATIARPSRLAGRVALVTGAGEGIGRSTAMLFAAEGARRSLAVTAAIERVWLAARSVNNAGVWSPEDGPVTELARAACGNGRWP